MVKNPEKPPLSLVGTPISGQIEPIDAPLRPLGTHGQQLWARVQAEYGISDIGGRELLTQCCEMLDRAEKLREAIERDGEILYTKAGPKLHPAVREETNLRVAISKGLERLGLNLEPARPHGGQSRAIGWTGKR